MPSFQKTILAIAVVVLVVSLTIIGVALSYASDQKEWPPVVSECPDYWKIDGSGNNTTCTNVKNLGICPAKTMNFNVDPYTGESGTCNKYTWATNCKVSWDGITYGVQNPCGD